MALRARYYTPDITSMNIRWKMQLKVHWTNPVEVHRNMPLEIHDDFRGVDFWCAIFRPQALPGGGRGVREQEAGLGLCYSYPRPCQITKFCELPTVRIRSTHLFYRLSWVWAWV